MFTSFRQIIDIWSDRTKFADALKVPYATANSMYARDSIDGKHFITLVMAAAQRGRSDVTLEVLCRLSARKIREILPDGDTETVKDAANG